MMESREAKEVTTNWVTASKRGTVSVQMTACDLISLAVNVAQNGHRRDEAPCLPDVSPIAWPDAVLREFYEQLRDANRQASARRGREKRR